MPYAIESVTQGQGTGDGPRIVFSDTSEQQAYLVVGSFEGLNQVLSGERPLVLVVEGGLTIQGLEPAPCGHDTVDLVVDRQTGRIYRQT